MRDLSRFLFLPFTAAIITLIVIKNLGLGSTLFGWISHIPHHDKIGHFFLMGALAFLAIHTIAPRMAHLSRRHASRRILATLTFLIAIEEISQAFIPARTFSIADLVLSLAGAWILGSLARREKVPKLKATDASNRHDGPATAPLPREEAAARG